MKIELRRTERHISTLPFVAAKGSAPGWADLVIRPDSVVFFTIYEVSQSGQPTLLNYAPLEYIPYYQHRLARTSNACCVRRRRNSQFCVSCLKQPGFSGPITSTISALRKAISGSPSTPTDPWAQLPRSEGLSMSMVNS